MSVDDESFPISSTAWPVFLLAVARAIRECEANPASSVGIRDLVDSHLAALLLEARLDGADRRSLRKIREIIDGMIIADMFSGVGGAHLVPWNASTSTGNHIG